MITIELPEQIEKEFSAIAARAGKTPEECAKEALLRYYEDLEDLMDCEEIVKNLDRSRLTSLEDLEKELGLEN